MACIAALKRANVVADWTYYEEFVANPLRFTNMGFWNPRNRFLVTCPHSASVPDDVHDRPFRDPLSSVVGNAVAQALMAPPCICAQVHRKVFDQNRLSGLYYACDMMIGLRVHREELERNGFSMKEVVHLDIHTFTGSSPPTGWGSGLNIICIEGADEQISFAKKFKLSFDMLYNTKFEQTKVIVMPRRPQNADDENSNAIIEWSRSRGALALLLEVPVEQTTFHCATDECWRVENVKQLSEVIKNAAFRAVYEFNAACTNRRN